MAHVADALANAAKTIDAGLAPKAWELLSKYIRLHFPDGDLDAVCISEQYDSLTGHPKLPHLDYAHSYFIDLVMRHIAGLEPDETGTLHIAPLPTELDWFTVEGVRCQGREIAVTWRRPGASGPCPEGYQVTVDRRIVQRTDQVAPGAVDLR
jgi:hypothetical protein